MINTARKLAGKDRVKLAQRLRGQQFYAWSPIEAAGPDAAGAGWRTEWGAAIRTGLRTAAPSDQRGVPGAEPGAGPQNRALWLDRLVAMATFKM